MREFDFFMLYQKYFLYEIGCYKLNTNPDVVTSSLTKEDCGKPKMILYAEHDKARKLAMKIFDLKEK